jgi:hypothetical protein
MVRGGCIGRFGRRRGGGRVGGRARCVVLCEPAFGFFACERHRTYACWYSAVMI